MKLFYFPDGRPSEHPTTRDQAIEIKSLTYNDGEYCKDCGVRSTQYTKTGECKWCARMRTANLHNLLADNGLVWTDENGVRWGTPSKDKNQIIPEDEYQETVQLAELVRSDVNITTTNEPCKHVGHFGVKRLGSCYQCHLEKLKPSPRQAAIQAGETWYTPGIVCKKCGERALKNIHNGECKGCKPPKQSNDSAATMLMQLAPDMIVSRSESIEQGFTVYRTGKECINGHTGWRYVSTGNCIDCRKES